jgi:starch phosphorylase
MVAADFDAYAATQRQVDALWRDSPDWNRRAIHNVARMGWFSSDRTIRQYAREVWGIPL